MKRPAPRRNRFEPVRVFHDSTHGSEYEWRDNLEEINRERHDILQRLRERLEQTGREMDAERRKRAEEVGREITLSLQEQAAEDARQEVRAKLLADAQASHAIEVKWLETVAKATAEVRAEINQLQKEINQITVRVEKEKLRRAGVLRGMRRRAA
jgi:hypothetical protein